MGRKTWYVHTGQEQWGPLSLEEMRSLAAQGRLHKNFFIWREGYNQWIPVSKVQKLFFSCPGNNTSSLPAGDPTPRPASSPPAIAAATLEDQTGPSPLRLAPRQEQPPPGDGPGDTSSREPSRLKFTDWYRKQFAWLEGIPGLLATFIHGAIWIPLWGLLWIPVWYFNTRTGRWPPRPRWIGVGVFLALGLLSLGTALFAETISERVLVPTGVRFAKDIWGRTRLDRLETAETIVEIERPMTASDRLIHATAGLVILGCAVLCFIYDPRSTKRH